MSKNVLIETLQRGYRNICENDEVLFSLLEKEHRRQQNTIPLIAASSLADPSVLFCQGTATTNITTEGYPGKRFHGGCRYADEIENLAIERAKLVFKAKYANVQPHSGTTANAIVLFSVLKPGDTILGMSLDSGGHLTHGSKASFSGNYYKAVGYGVDTDGFINYEEVRSLALEYHPKLIICGASSYPRIIDFSIFRDIADEIDALLLADISHISGLVASGFHPSPIDLAHFTTTSTYKQLFGPRGGLILMGKDYDQRINKYNLNLAELVQRATFPGIQGTPLLNSISAKCRALGFVASPDFKEIANRIVGNSKVLSLSFLRKGYDLLTGGTDNHMVVLNILENGITGVVAEKALEECNIIVNKNKIPNDKNSAFITSGLRLGTNCVSFRGFESEDMIFCFELIDKVLSSLKIIDDKRYILRDKIRNEVLAGVKEIVSKYPIPGYSL